MPERQEHITRVIERFYLYSPHYLTIIVAALGDGDDWAAYCYTITDIKAVSHEELEQRAIEHGLKLTVAEATRIFPSLDQTKLRR